MKIKNETSVCESDVVKKSKLLWLKKNKEQFEILGMRSSRCRAYVYVLLYANVRNSFGF